VLILTKIIIFLVAQYNGQPALQFKIPRLAVYHFRLRHMVQCFFPIDNYINKNICSLTKGKLTKYSSLFSELLFSTKCSVSQEFQIQPQDLLSNTNFFENAHNSLAATFNTAVTLVCPFQPILHKHCLKQRR